MEGPVRLLCILILLNRADCTGSSLSTTTDASVDWTSCSGRCVEGYIPGLPCYCNEACFTYENCCDDYYSICKPEQLEVDDWVAYGRREYRYFDDVTATARSAGEACRQDGALLVSVRDRGQHQFLVSRVLRSRTLTVFISAKAAAKSVFWKWADGASVPLPSEPWSEWYPGEPNRDGDTETCAVLTNYKFWAIRKVSFSSYYWVDFGCDANSQQVQGYICERSRACDPNPCNNGGLCAFIGGALETECRCMDGFVGANCQGIAGEPWTACGETRLTGPSGEVTSPQFPRPYPALTRCNWTITVSTGNTLTFRLESLAVEGGKDCVFDRLMVYDGTSTGSPPLLGPVCEGSLTTLRRPLQSTSNSVLIVFTSDDSRQDQGFRIGYNENKCGQGSGQSGCGTARRLVADCGHIEVLRGPHGGATECRWSISVARGKTLNVTFTKFDIEDTDASCSGGGLAVYDSSSEGTGLVQRYCGRAFPWSIMSTGRHLTLVLSGVTWSAGNIISMVYEAKDVSNWRVVNPTEKVEGLSGQFSSLTSPVQVETASAIIQKWRVRVPVGQLITLQWSMTSTGSSVVKVLDGCCEESVPLVDLNIDPSRSATSRQGEVTGSEFQTLIYVKRSKDDSDFRFDVVFTSKDWTPSLSGCYRPLYASSMNDPSTENSLVTPKRPVFIMAAKESHQFNDPGYGPGLYCTWLIQTGEDFLASVQLLNLDIVRRGSSCDADGVVVYGGATVDATKYGPFCGASSDQLIKLIEPGSRQVKVVFYSDTMGGRRVNGTFRAAVRTAEQSECRFDEMTTPETVIMTSPCGVMSSPRLPGDVEPGLWTWIIAPPSDRYFLVSVAYVRGPSILGECATFFRLLEIARDSSLRRHWEAELLKVCQNEQLRMLDDPIKVPLNQKLGVELSTAAAQFPQRWEFKLSYASHILPPPDGILASSPRCPQDYIYYRDSCYRYYHWYYRQVDPDNFRFLETWQAAKERCAEEGSHLVSITDEDEARFIKYSLSRNGTFWLWDEAGTWQTNHRLVFIGLNNRYGRYVWDSGVSMAYADWYRPPGDGFQPAVHPDTEDADLLRLASGQPSADLGSLCVVMMTTSPYGSLNWAKLPCDYPIRKAGAICEQAAAPDPEAPLTAQGLPMQIETQYQGCPKGWVAIIGRCLRMFTYYERLSSARRQQTALVDDLSQNEASLKCEQLGGTLAVVDENLLGEVRNLLVLWRHNDLTGHIRVAKAGEKTCQLIQVLKREDSTRMVEYNLMSTPCESPNRLGVYSVLCQRGMIEMAQTCMGDNRYACADGSCIDIDFRCDADIDCKDGSDENDCGSGLDTFLCDNGNRISVGLVCNFVDNCRDNSDENGCVLKMCDENSFSCTSGECIPDQMACDFRSDCEDGSDERPELCDSQCSAFQCFSGRCIQSQLVQDLVSDCPGLSQEDENTYRRGLDTLQSNTGQKVELEVVNETIVVSCETSGEHAQCRFNHGSCFRRAATCVYDRKLTDAGRKTEVQRGCRDGSHLRDLCGPLPCPGMFHCPGSYCLPLSRLCDGTPDCPLGQDEATSCANYTCPGLLQCKGAPHCIPSDKICDGATDCPLYGDDEKYCGVTDILCSGDCQCEGNILRCENLGLSDVQSPMTRTTRQLRALFLSENQIKVKEVTFNGLHWAIVLDLSRNKLDTIPDGAFRDLVNLRELYLNDNSMVQLSPALFEGLISLQKLDLTNNLVSALRKDTFSGLISLQHLRLERNPLDDVMQDSFTSLKTLYELNTDAFKFCCIARQVSVCTPAPDEFSSCEDLMSNYTLQVSIWVLGVFAFAGNIFVVVWRMLTERARTSSFFIINLGAADFLMGLYLLIIASVDVHYRGQYIVYADRWRASGLCQFAGIISMLSSEASIFMLCAITADRLYSIMFPLKAPNFRLKHARIVAGAGWGFCTIISVMPALRIPYFGDAFFGRTGVCLPFHLSKERLPGWQYAVTIFLVANFIAFMFVLVAYIMIFYTVRSSMKALGSSKSAASTDEYSLAKKLALIVATDFLCWVPIILIGFAALGGADINPQVAAWVAVFVLPLNSAVNPILYTLSNVQCGKKKRSPVSGTSQTMSTVATRGPTVAEGVHNEAYVAPDAQNGKGNSAL